MRFKLLVVAQFSLIILIISYTGFIGNSWQNLISLFGVGLGVYSLLVMRFRFHLTPDLRPGSPLYTSGPYRLIRHPMYTSVMTCCFNFISFRLDYLSVFLGVCLFIVLYVKSTFEEKILSARFSEYASYCRRTKKFLPFVY